MVIENQLGPIDHDHLGKLLTYWTNLEAKIAIWIPSDSRPTHVKAVVWLNEVTPSDTAFSLVQLAVYRISGSDPTTLFTPIVGPSSKAKDVGASRRELGERHVLRKEFGGRLLAQAKERGVKVHAECSPSSRTSLGAGLVNRDWASDTWCGGGIRQRSSYISTRGIENGANAFSTPFTLRRTPSRARLAVPSLGSAWKATERVEFDPS